MQLLAALISLLPITGFFTSAPTPRVEQHLYAIPHAASSLLLLSLFGRFSLHHLEDAFIGFSSVAIAATLACFLITSGPRIPFRRSLIALTVCTTFAGLCSLLASTSFGVSHALFTGLSPMFGAILALFTACLLPFLLPFLLSRSLRLEATTVAVLRTETRFLAATESSSDAFFLLEAVRTPYGSIEDFIFTFLNANAEKIIDRPASEVIGSRITSVLPIDPDGRLLRQYRDVVLTGVPLIHEFPLDENNPDSPWMRHHVGRVRNGSADIVPGGQHEDQPDGLAVTASDITGRKHAELNRPGESQHDALTGLPNRRLLDDRIQQAFARADRYHNRVALFRIDLDRFENVNEHHGWNLADRTLIALASRLRAGVRTTDSVLRIEGDEFIVLMPDMLLEVDIRRAAATLLAILREPLNLEDELGLEASAAQTPILGRHGLRVTGSLGVAIYPESAVTVPDLIDRAEQALLRAKAQGGNQYVLYTPPNQPDVDEESELEVQLDPSFEPYVPDQLREGN